MTRLRLLSLAALFAAALAAAVACAAEKKPTQDDLVHHRYVLASVDGEAYKSEMRAPEIEFGEGFRVFGAVCNRFAGQGELKNGVLTVKQMASTKMLCPGDALNALETLFGEMLMAGSEVALEEGTLTLRQGGRTLTFTLQDKVQ